MSVLPRLFSSRLAIVAPFILLAIVGLTTFRDYGLPYDEGVMDSLGEASYAYVFHNKPWPTNVAYRYHGTVVELPLYTVQRLFFKIDDVRHRYRFRRLVCFAFFFLGTVALYAIARRHFPHRWQATLSMGMFVLTPRIFAQGLYNSRDIPELSLFTLGIFTLLRLLERRTIGAAAIHALVCALALGVRMTALLLPALTILFLAIEWWRHADDKKSLTLKHTTSLGGIYLALLPIATITVWPFLWEQPITHFLEAYRFMSSLGGDMTWDYIPIWIFVTVPLAFTFFFLIGITSAGVSLLRVRRNLSAVRRNELLFLLWVFLPVIAILITRAGIYTEWRHVYFLYPGFVLLSVTGFTWLYQNVKIQILKYAVTGIMTLQLLFTGIWMVRYHPFQYVYFSVPARFIEGKFDLDYWALSYKQIIEFLLNYDKDPHFNVYSDENVAFYNAFLTKEGPERILRARSPETARYIITRLPEVLPETYRQTAPIYVININGLVINAVYKGGNFGKPMPPQE